MIPWATRRGDQLLIQMSERIRNTLRAHDVVARLGGDEFALLLNGWSRRRKHPIHWIVFWLLSANLMN